MGGWKSGRIENGGRMEMWEDRKYFYFLFFFVWLGVKKWRDRKNEFE